MGQPKWDSQNGNSHERPIETPLDGQLPQKFIGALLRLLVMDPNRFYTIYGIFGECDIFCDIGRGRCYICGVHVTLARALENNYIYHSELFASHFEAFNTLKTRSHGVLMGLSAKLRQIWEQPRTADCDPSGRPIATKIYRDTPEITSNRSQSFLDNLGHFWRL